MKTEKVQTVFFFAVLILSFLLMAYVIYPFLGALTLALAIAIVFRPLFRKIVRRFNNRRGLAAFVTILIVLVTVVVPLSFAGVKIFNEVSQIYIDYSSEGPESGILDTLSTGVNQFIGNFAPGINFDIGAHRQQIVEWLFLNLNNIFSSAIRIIFNLFIIFITLYYLLKDGYLFKKMLKRFSPLSDKEDETVMDRLELTINAVVKGSLVIAAVQGLLAGVGFAIFSIPQPILLAVLATLAAVLPGIGTGLVFIPVIIYMAAVGEYGAALGLLAWATAVVGLVDNFLRPYLLERDIKIHPLLIFLSVLGGLSVFGALGFILGPIILSFVYSLSHIYLGTETKRKTHAA